MLKKSILLVLVSILASISIFGCTNAPQSNTKEIFVFAAGGTKPAIDEAALLFEQNTGIRVLVNYGGGGEILSSMVLSKTGDMYIAPEQKFMTSAKNKGAIDNNAVIYSCAYMIPVIGVRDGNPLNIQSLDDLAQEGIKIAICNPETTSLGVLAPQILEKAGLYEEVKQNIATYAPQVTSIVTMLKMNQVDAGIIWHHFGTSNSNDIDIIWIPEVHITGIAEIQAAISTYSQEKATAQSFIDFLISSEGKEIFEKNGYMTNVEEVNKLWQPNQ